MVIHMKILKLFKIKSLKSNPINYEKDTYWYTNNYNMLGYKWLYDALKKMHLKKDFSFLSPSANIGMYESDTFNALKNDDYDPIFYLSDLYNGKLKNKAKERENFFWILGDEVDASEIKISNIKEEKAVPIKFDVILDCKGAIWHSLNSSEMELHDVIKLLKNYCNLLRTDESILLIDSGMPSLVRKMFDMYLKILCPSSRVRKKKINIHYMYEYTTYYYLFNYVEKFIQYKYFHSLMLEINCNCKDKFDISSCTKTQLKQCIEKLEHIDAKQYKKNVKKCKNLNSIYALLPIFVVVVIVLFLIFCI